MTSAISGNAVKSLKHELVSIYTDWLTGAVVASWSLMQEVAGSSPFTVMTNIFVTEFTEPLNSVKTFRETQIASDIDKVHFHVSNIFEQDVKLKRYHVSKYPCNNRNHPFWGQSLLAEAQPRLLPLYFYVNTHFGVYESKIINVNWSAIPHFTWTRSAILQYISTCHNNTWKINIAPIYIFWLFMH